MDVEIIFDCLDCYARDKEKKLEAMREAAVFRSNLLPVPKSRVEVFVEFKGMGCVSSIFLSFSENNQLTMSLSAIAFSA